MRLQNKTIEKLRQLINEETEYRSGFDLVTFFNELGFRESYGQGFPSRWIYTEEKLKRINGTSKIEECIKKLFLPINFVGRFEQLDRHIAAFNEYLAFDELQVIRNGKDVQITKAQKDFSAPTVSLTEDAFLSQEFKSISVDKLNLDGALIAILQQRLDEIQKCLKIKSPLATIFLCGSTLEGILLGIAIKHPQKFSLSGAAPKDNGGMTKPFSDWSLNNLIDVSWDIGLLQEDVKKFSHALRDFRNYIHPYQQASTNFNPNEHTAKICWQVLQVAIHQLIR